jgi:hypothetical protein
MAGMMLGAALVMAAGCGGSSGPERASVAGKVTLDGTPLAKGSISFIPTGATQGPAAGAVIENGAYATAQGTGPVLGEHRVEIIAFKAGKEATAPGIDGATAGPSAASGAPEMEAFIPEEYNKNSQLTLKVASGTNNKDFELKSIP